MRTVATLFAALLLSAAVSGQDRLVVLGTVGPYLPAGGTAALVEAAVDGTTIGVPQAVVTGQPPHLVPSRQLVAVAGGRYVAWLAAPIEPGFPPRRAAVYTLPFSIAACARCAWSPIWCCHVAAS